MKIKYRNLAEWHKWFAWHPIRVGNSLVWLSYVERRLDDNGWDVIAEYRAGPDPCDDYLSATKGAEQ